MKLLLSQQELEQAVTRYVTGMINLAEGTDIAIDFKAGRGENGITAEVDISYMSVTSIPAIQATMQPASVNTAAGPNIRAAAAAVVEAPSLDEDTKAEPETKPATRKATGKSLFGNARAGVVAETTTEPANDDTAGEVEVDTEPKAAAAGERKTLFS